MELNGDISSIKKTKRLYKFSLYQVKKIEPTGNLVRNLPCPLPRSGHRIVLYKGNIFAFGGYSARHPETNEIINEPNNRPLFKELWKFNLASKTWYNVETIGSMPTELASHSAVVVENFMLTYGGTGVPFGLSSSNSTNLCHLDLLEWFSIFTVGEIPPPLYGQAVGLHNNKLYVIGGTTGFDYTICVHCLDLHTKEWTRLDNIKKQIDEPPTRYRHEIVTFDDRIFVLGGGTVSGSFDFAEIPTFSLVDYTWNKTVTTTTTEFPNPRLCHGCVQFENDVYICGGHNGHSIFSDIWKINLKQLQWNKLNVEMPIPLYFHAVTMSEEGHVFIFGGVTDTRNEIRTNEVFSMWLTIPSLSNMCWQALLMYIPGIAQMNKQKLFQDGVPLKYLDEIEFDTGDQKSKLCCRFDTF